MTNNCKTKRNLDNTGNGCQLTVPVYSDPIGELHQEGNALLVRKKQENFLDETGLELWEVQFNDVLNYTHTRWIHEKYINDSTLPKLKHVEAGEENETTKRD